MARFNTNFLGTLPFADIAPQYSLLAGVELTYTVPGGKNKSYRARLSYPNDASVWVAKNTTATLPAPGVMNPNSNCELNPRFRYVRGGDVLSFISDSDMLNGGISLLELPDSN